MTRTKRIQPKHSKRTNHRYTVIPCLTLEGKWMEAAGFRAGAEVRILETDSGLLVQLV